MNDKLKDILNPPVKGGVKRIKKVLDRYIIDKKEKKEVLKEIVNLGQNNTEDNNIITPRCFILDTIDIVCAPNFIQLTDGNVTSPNLINKQNVIMFPDPTDCLNPDYELCDIETWISINKEHIIAEISYEEFLGNKVDGHFSKIRLVHPGSTESSEVESPYFLDDFSKQRLNYLSNNRDKAIYNFISLTSPSEQKPSYAKITNFYTFISNNIKHVVINIERIPPFGNINTIIIPLNAEVLPQ